MVEQHIKANMGVYAIPAVVHAVQEDTARVFIFDIVDYTILGTETASLMCVRPDGTAYSYSGTVSAANQTVTVALNISGGALSQVGIVDAQLVMTISSKEVCSFKMSIIVEEKIGGPASQDDKDFLSGLQAQLDAYMATKTAQITALVDAVGNMKYFSDTVPTNGSKTITFVNSTRCVIFCVGYSNGTKGAYLVTCTSSGAMGVVDIVAGTNISYTTGTNTMTISNSYNNSQVYVNIITFAGGIS